MVAAFSKHFVASSAAGLLLASFPAEAKQSFQEWSPWFSDGDGPKYCNGAIAGLECRDRYCDDVRMLCDFSAKRFGNRGWWTAWFSEEGSHSSVCPQNGFVTGMECSGDYCDSMRLHCQDIKDVKYSNCRWLEQISDESEAFEFPKNTLLRGLSCKGRYCDDLESYVCDIEHFCEVTKVEGQWKMRSTIVTETDETFKWGTEVTHETSKSDSWSKSLSVAVSTGFEVVGVSGRVSISRTMGQQQAHAMRNSLTTSKYHEVTYHWKDEDINKMVWQWVFEPTDSCGHRELSKAKQFAVTAGAWAEPCCLPGWAKTREYAGCMSAEALISKSDHCRVVDRSRRRRSSNDRMHSFVEVETETNMTQDSMAKQDEQPTSSAMQDDFLVGEEDFLADEEDFLADHEVKTASSNIALRGSRTNTSEIVFFP